MSKQPRYIEVNLSTAESVAAEPVVDAARLFDPDTGKAVGVLPATEIPCDGEPDEHADPKTQAPHYKTCKCFGTGFVTVRRLDIAPVDVEDDSLVALEVALANREAAAQPLEADYLGDTVENLMKRQVDRSGSSSGGSKKKQIDPKRVAAFDPPPSAIDGRFERGKVERRGRPTRFGETRDSFVTTSMNLKTANIMAANAIDISALVEQVFENPEAAELLRVIAAEQIEQAGT